MKKLTALFLTLAMILTISACGSLVSDNNTPDTSKNPSTGDEAVNNSAAPVDSDEPTSLVACVNSDPGSLSPYGINRGGKQAVRSAVFESLFWLDADKNLCPILGKSYKALGDGVYEVELFDYIKDSAGNPLKASDVVYSIDLMAAEGHGGNYIGALSKYEAVSDYVIRLEFANNYAGNFESLATGVYCVTQAAWEAAGEPFAGEYVDNMIEAPVGTGLYKFVSGETGYQYVFEARDDYWQTDEQYICEKNTCNIDNFTLRIISDTGTIAVSLEKGEIDYTMNIEGDDRSNFIEDDGTAKDGYILKEMTNASLIRLSFNCSDKSPCQDINLRKAIAYCIDSAACAQRAQGALATVCTAFVNPVYLDADASVNDLDDYYNYNETLAKDYLSKSAYKGETLKLLVQPNENTSSAAVLIQAYCDAIGIKVELLEYEAAMYNDYHYSEDPTLYDFNIFGINSAISHFWKAHYELDVNQYSTGVNHLFIADNKLQSLYETSASAATNTVESTNELIQYVTDNCYEYALFYYNTVYVGRDYVKEVVTGGGNAESIYNAFVVG